MNSDGKSIQRLRGNSLHASLVAPFQPRYPSPPGGTPTKHGVRTRRRCPRRARHLSAAFAFPSLGPSLPAPGPSTAARPSPTRTSRQSRLAIPAGAAGQARPGGTREPTPSPPSPPPPGLPRPGSRSSPPLPAPPAPCAGPGPSRGRYRPAPPLTAGPAAPLRRGCARRGRREGGEKGPRRGRSGSVSATWQRPAVPRCCGCTAPCCGRASASAATATGAGKGSGGGEHGDPRRGGGSRPCLGQGHGELRPREEPSRALERQRDRRRAWAQHRAWA